MSFQPPGNPPPPPPGGWQPPQQPPPGGYGAPPPPGFGTPPPGYGAPPEFGPPPGGPPPWAPPPPPPKRSHKGLIIGLSAAVIVVLIVVALAVVANRATGGTELAEFRRGECFTTSKALVAEKATRVECAKPHTDEVAGVIRFPDPDGARYPGQTGILDLGKKECAQQVAEFYGTKNRSLTTQLYVFGPNQAAWKNGERAVVCSLREQSAAKRTGSYLDG